MYGELDNAPFGSMRIGTASMISIPSSDQIDLLNLEAGMLYCCLGLTPAAEAFWLPSRSNFSMTLDSIAGSCATP